MCAIPNPPKPPCAGGMPVSPLMESAQQGLPFRSQADKAVQAGLRQLGWAVRAAQHCDCVSTAARPPQKKWRRLGIGVAGWESRDKRRTAGLVGSSHRRVSPLLIR